MRDLSTAHMKPRSTLLFGKIYRCHFVLLSVRVLAPPVLLNAREAVTRESTPACARERLSIRMPLSFKRPDICILYVLVSLALKCLLNLIL